MAEQGHISVLLILLWLAVPSNAQQFSGNADCSLPKEVGPCEARLPRFFYNARAQKCALFFYGGCYGNANNFKSSEECEYRCQHSDGDTEQEQDACANADCPPGTTCVPEECLIQPCAQFQCRPNVRVPNVPLPNGNPCDSSPCSNGDKCVYNPLIQCTRAPCAQYYCQKGGDRHEDKCALVNCPQGQICQPRQQMCFVPPCPQHECVENPCHLVDCPTNRPQCILVDGRAECVDGAPAPGNNQDTALELCSQLPPRGDCSATLRRWYFNRQTSQCEPYKFGMCGGPGNANRFETKLACETKCQKVPPCPPPPEAKPGCRIVTQLLHQITLCPIQQEVCEDAGNNCTSMLCSSGSTCSLVDGRAKCVVSGGRRENNSKLIKCSPPPETGRCRASITRWYYNRQTGECVQFAYGGCGGNLNRYNTLEQCQRTCGDVPPCPAVATTPPPKDCRVEGVELDADLCIVPKVVCDERNTCPSMNCPADSPCQMVDGLARCVKKAVDEYKLLMCSQIPDAGVGLESIQKWTYNRLTSRCEQFSYSGRGGNANRFMSKEQCEQRCQGVDPCPMISEPARRPGCRYEGPELNKDTLCPQPKLVCKNEHVCSTAECDRNSVCQVIDGRAECVPMEGDKGHIEKERLQVCSQLPQRGPCPAAVPRWRYNRQTSSCEKFIYGGCQGNENNFETQSSCEQLCRGIEQCPSVSVSFPPVGCRYEGEELSDSYCPIPKLICNETEACKVCLMRDSCKMTRTGAICVPATFASASNAPLPDECKLHKNSGSCEDHVPAFYFDSSTSECLQFSYSGCQGNGNRFSTLKHCERVCITKRHCIIPPMVPPPPGCDYAISNDEEGCPIRHKLRCADRVVIRN